VLLTPVPMGERRSSGTSPMHSIFRDETYLLVDVSVSEVKKGCALGVVLEHLDESGLVIAAEIVATYAAPRAHKRVTTAKGSRLRIKWVLTGDKPSSTFGVSAEGFAAIPMCEADDPDHSEVHNIDLTTFEDLRKYLESMMHAAQVEGDGESTARTDSARHNPPPP
jgi:hypothetical protein